MSSEKDGVGGAAFVRGHATIASSTETRPNVSPNVSPSISVAACEQSASGAYTPAACTRTTQHAPHAASERPEKPPSGESQSNAARSESRTTDQDRSTQVTRGDAACAQVDAARVPTQAAKSGGTRVEPCGNVGDRVAANDGERERAASEGERERAACVGERVGAESDDVARVDAWVAECERLFATRYTNEDDGYMRTLLSPPLEPPCIPHWFARKQELAARIGRIEVDCAAGSAASTGAVTVPPGVKDGQRNGPAASREVAGIAQTRHTGGAPTAPTTNTRGVSAAPNGGTVGGR